MVALRKRLRSGGTAYGGAVRCHWGEKAWVVVVVAGSINEFGFSSLGWVAMGWCSNPSPKGRRRHRCHQWLHEP